MAKTKFWNNQKILKETQLFDKRYLWLEDVDGTIYLARWHEDDDRVEPLI